MKVDPNQAKIVALTVHEIFILIGALTSAIPSKDEEQAVVNIVEKLKRAVGS